MGSWGNSSEEILRQQFPLHHACRDGDVRTVCALLGDVNELGPANGLFQEDAFYGWTPAHWAAYFGKLPCLVRLIEQGEVSCNISTFRFHQSPLHIAAFGGHGHCVQWLLHRGAQIERQDYLGETCLHKAARTGSLECVSLLVSQGSNLKCTNFKNQTPAQLALACSFEECARYLERALELQQPKRGIFQDLLPPVCHAPSVEKIESHGHPDAIHRIIISQGLNGGAIPPVDNCQVSCINGESDRISQAMDEDSMDTGDATEMDEVVGRPHFNGAGGQGDAVSNGDILMLNGVGRNCIAIAGRKRGREEVDIECLKRIRRGEADIRPQMVSVDGVESVTMLPRKFINPNRNCTRINGRFLQTTMVGELPPNGLSMNGHHPGMTNGNHLLYNSNQDSVTDSALEHQTTVAVQHGYHSLIVDSLISGTHGI